MNIEINGKEYAVEELSSEVQVMVSRVSQLRAELAEMSQLANEKQVLIDAYGSTIANAVEQAETDAEDTE